MGGRCKKPADSTGACPSRLFCRKFLSSQSILCNDKGRSNSRGRPTLHCRGSDAFENFDPAIDGLVAGGVTDPEVAVVPATSGSRYDHQPVPDRLFAKGGA